MSFVAVVGVNVLWVNELRFRERCRRVVLSFCLVRLFAVICGYFRADLCKLHANIFLPLRENIPQWQR